MEVQESNNEATDERISDIMSKVVITDQQSSQESKPFVPFKFYDEDERRKLEEDEKASNKVYLILFAGYLDNDSEIGYQQWNYVIGRQNAYDVIAETLMSIELADQGVTFNAYKSRIIVESDSGKVRLDGISIYKFCRTMRIQNLVENHFPAFDIEEWATDESENDEND